MHLPTGFNAVEVRAIERAGQNPNLREAELAQLLNPCLPHVNCGFCPVYLFRPPRVCYRVLRIKNDKSK